MGNAHTEDFRNENLVNELQTHYEKTGDFKDPRFGNVQIFHEKFNPSSKLMFKQRWTKTDAESRQLHAFIEKRRMIEDESIAKLPLYEVSQEKQMLNTFYRHSMGFEYYPKTLQTEIERVQSKTPNMPNDTSQFHVKDHHSEEEIWFMLRNVTDAMAAFRRHNYHHGDIQPHNIMIDNAGNPKVIDHSLVNYGRTGYHKMIFGEDYTSPLSPALMEGFRDKKIDVEHDKVKSDIYSLGMTTLATGNKNDFNKYYDWDLKRIRTVPTGEAKTRLEIQSGGAELTPNVPDYVGQGLHNMNRRGYSQELTDLTARMLDYNEKSRLDLDSLRGAIQHHYNHLEDIEPIQEPAIIHPEPVHVEQEAAPPMMHFGAHPDEYDNVGNSDFVPNTFGQPTQAFGSR